MRLGSKFHTAIRVWQNFGFTEVVKIPFRKISSLTASPGKIENFSAVFVTPVKFTSPSAQFLAACGRDKVNVETVDEYIEYLRSYKVRTKEPRLGFFDEIYDLGPALGLILFELIKNERPVKVIETGVAAGASSNLILESLNRTGSGSLTSVDITLKVGELVEDHLKVRWEVKVLPKSFKKKAFTGILNANSDATIFVHDSDHSLNWQIFEISSVVAAIPNINFILVDDVSIELANYFKNYMPRWKLIVIDEGRKFSGFLSRI
jgi:hypothetical protein